MNVAVDMAAHEVAQAAIECGERVVENDPHGRCVTIDLYAHSLSVATKYNLSPVRVLTAADDLVRGLRDFLRGPKTSRFGMFGPTQLLNEYDTGWWTSHE